MHSSIAASIPNPPANYGLIVVVKLGPGLPHDLVALPRKNHRPFAPRPITTVSDE